MDNDKYDSEVSQLMCWCDLNDNPMDIAASGYHIKVCLI